MQHFRLKNVYVSSLCSSKTHQSEPPPVTSEESEWQRTWQDLCGPPGPAEHRTGFLKCWLSPEGPQPADLTGGEAPGRRGTPSSHPLQPNRQLYIKKCINNFKIEIIVSTKILLDWCVCFLSLYISISIMHKKTQRLRLSYICMQLYVDLQNKLLWKGHHTTYCKILRITSQQIPGCQFLKLSDFPALFHSNPIKILTSLKLVFKIYIQSLTQQSSKSHLHIMVSYRQGPLQLLVSRPPSPNPQSCLPPWPPWDWGLWDKTASTPLWASELGGLTS